MRCVNFRNRKLGDFLFTAKLNLLIEFVHSKMNSVFMFSPIIYANIACLDSLKDKGTRVECSPDRQRHKKMEELLMDGIERVKVITRLTHYDLMKQMTSQPFNKRKRRVPNCSKFV